MLISHVIVVRVKSHLLLNRITKLKVTYRVNLMTSLLQLACLLAPSNEHQSSFAIKEPMSYL